MPAYRITITMPDGSQGVHSGIYNDGFEAVQQTYESFAAAKRVSAKPLQQAAAQAQQDTYGSPDASRTEGARA